MKKSLLGLIAMVAVTAGAAHAEVARFWLMYRLPANIDLQYEARRIEANALSQRNVEIQSCANGNDSAACNISAEIAFRRRILAIPGARFAVYYVTNEMGTQSEWLMDLTSKEAVDRELNQKFVHLEPEAPGDMDLMIETNDCHLLRNSDWRDVKTLHARFTEYACKIVAAQKSANAYLWSRMVNKETTAPDTDEVDFFLKHGVSVEQSNVDGVTLLMATGLRGMPDVAKLLISKGASIDKKDNNGTTALGWAASNGHLDIAKLLVKNGAEVDGTQDTDRGTTAMMYAAANGHADVTRYLINEGAAVDSWDRFTGCRALNYAARDGYHEVVDVLLDHGASVNVSCLGRSALKAAAEEGHNDIVELLRKHGADE